MTDVFHYVTPDQKRWTNNSGPLDLQTSCGRFIPKAHYTQSVSFFLNHSFLSVKSCQECYDTIDPLEILAHTEL